MSVTVTWHDDGAHATVRHRGNGNYVVLARADVERASTDPDAAAHLLRRLTTTTAFDVVKEAA